ncbi:hypothetical protein DICVIV_03125 [Dictyocaulus viviparus]|uniref:Uncharacterized protein n=1 Tax=Dictyocaulus viviparus TaxID=29172 RepID=A0A0D8Y1Y7_DICVI|nr:hypothetical protein DICVIV_03125 [Dictyocaulus viviparus]
MNRKRKYEDDGIQLSQTPKRQRSCNEELDSDDSLHLPDTIFDGEDMNSSKGNVKKKQRQKSHNSINRPEPATEIAVDREGETRDTLCKAEPTKGPFDLYLIRKPVEVSIEDLTNSSIPIRSCFSKGKKVLISGKRFIARGVETSSQMIHIPADTIHASQAPWFTCADSPITGSVILSRAEFSDVVPEKLGSQSDSTDSLPFKRIKKKISLKGIRNLKQRLRAYGVKNAVS